MLSGVKRRFICVAWPGLVSGRSLQITVLQALSHQRGISFRPIGRVLLALLVGVLLANGPACLAQSSTKGEWSSLMTWPNVAIHASVLPNGKVLFWGRREWRTNGTPAESLDARNCTPRLWNPATGAITKTPQPGFNLFCSGHTFLNDGRLLVVGGHIADGLGEPHATIYNPTANTWTRIADMNRGRWYPTAVALPDGGVLVSSGSDENGQVNPVQQIARQGQWSSIVDFEGLPLYPRMHVASDGRVFMAGPLQLTQYLDTSGAGQWTPVGDRINAWRDYAPSVLYNSGRVLFAGGGNPPTAAAEIIDLNQQQPAWKATGAMNFPRRQHNATLLPDGTVLVTGGTRGSGGPGHGFNDIRAGQPVHAAELWNPATGQWSVLAAERVDRCYHSVAVLLPDARVLSAGGGEYRPDNAHDNDPKDSQRNAQVFSPPYLFRGTRPTIIQAPSQVAYGESFTVKTFWPSQISQVSWIRLSSTTHSFNQSQRINFLEFAVSGSKLQVYAPDNSTVCPPGDYMLFLLNQKKVPSVAKIIRIHEKNP
jgi:galactose oxidase